LAMRRSCPVCKSRTSNSPSVSSCSRRRPSGDTPSARPLCRSSEGLTLRPVSPAPLRVAPPGFAWSAAAPARPGRYRLDFAAQVVDVRASHAIGPEDVGAPDELALLDAEDLAAAHLAPIAIPACGHPRYGRNRARVRRAASAGCSHECP